MARHDDDGHGDVADDHDEGTDRTDEGGAEAMLRGHPAMFAANWRTVLVVDALMGVAVAVVGIVVAVAWNIVAGGVLGSIGVAYVAAVVRRGRSWAEQRRRAGL